MAVPAPPAPAARAHVLALKQIKSARGGLLLGCCWAAGAGRLLVAD